MKTVLKNEDLVIGGIYREYLHKDRSELLHTFVITDRDEDYIKVIITESYNKHAQGKEWKWDIKSLLADESVEKVIDTKNMVS